MLKQDLKWYVLMLNTPKSFSIYHKQISAIIPKGCAVLAVSKVRHHPYFYTKLDRKIVFNDYVFILCNLEKHGKQIIKLLKARGIGASILEDQNKKPLEISVDEIMRIKKDDTNLSVDSKYKLGEQIKVVYGPMSGFIGNISQITDNYISCFARIGDIVTHIPFFFLYIVVY